ncbi:class I SAM-dependent methyltransferase [Pseudoalteromonas sp. T1lg65]|uniref:class I SAM-dependent methyltransferase n=1 Tax=Pseudoalteromonas sp. T1lg65 TaxID=2077101 RepID=UPI003F797947
MLQNPYPTQCGLCQSTHVISYYQDKKRSYWQCQQCSLVFVDPRERLSPEQEKAIYDSHENDLEDAGYRRFLSRVLEPLLARLKKPSRGLDFGCGPGPLLAKMLAEAKHEVALFDLFYANHPEVLESRYDFIVCTEVIEHVAEPGKVLAKLLSILELGAPLALMTKLVINKERFASWHYKNDLTHISFFSRSTFEYVARHFDCELEFIGTDVIILTKHASALNNGN